MRPESLTNFYFTDDDSLGLNNTEAFCKTYTGKQTYLPAHLKLLSFSSYSTYQMLRTIRLSQQRLQVFSHIPRMSASTATSQTPLEDAIREKVCLRSYVKEISAWAYS